MRDSVVSLPPERTGDSQLLKIAPKTPQALRIQINSASDLEEKDRLMLHALALIASYLELIVSNTISG